MPIGPVELLVLTFPGIKFTGEIVPALVELVESGTVRILDLLIVNKNQDGTVEMVEVQDLDLNDARFDPLVSDLTDLLTDEDVESFGTLLEPNSFEVLILFENTWAARFVEAVRSANGQVVINERIPRAVIEELTATATV